MKRLFFIFLLSFFIFCFTFSETINEVSLPKEIKYSGKLRDSITFTDSLGVHILITSELETDRNNNDMGSSFLFAYDYLRKGNNSSYKLNWKLEDGEKDCPLDYFSKFTDTPSITDLDKNGIKEVTMVYTKTCTGDISAQEYKVIMRENQNKYGLRGTTFDPISKGEPGENPCCAVENAYNPLVDDVKYQNENDFKKAPKEFLDYAKKLWIKYR